MGREKDQNRSHREEELHKPWLDTAKIRAIISAWLDYIWLEDLTNAKVKAGNSSNPLIWDKNVNSILDFRFWILDFPLLERQGLADFRFWILD